MMQYRLSTLLLAFVVVWASLAVFGSVGGIVVAALLLAAAAYVRSTKSRTRARMLIAVLVVLLCGFALVGLLVPKDGFVQEGAERAACVNNLKQLGLALYNYETATGHCPPAIVTDKQGRAMHSWRTLILPYLEQSTLYRGLNLAEPWDAPKNKALAAQHPQYQYVCPEDRSAVDRGLTSYVAVTGPGTAWDDHRPAAGPPRVMVVEFARGNIPWMEPRDLTLDEACRAAGDPGGPLGLGHTRITDTFFYRDETIRYVNALCSDGSVWSLPAGLPPATLRGLFTGDRQAWKVCQAASPLPWRSLRIHWTNCTALAVLVISYAVLLFRRRDKLPPQAEPATPAPAAAAGGNESGK